jgi:hypothetical protein
MCRHVIRVNLPADNVQYSLDRTQTTAEDAPPVAADKCVDLGLDLGEFELVPVEGVNLFVSGALIPVR